jgi:hypothetical protein
MLGENKVAKYRGVKQGYPLPLLFFYVYNCQDNGIKEVSIKVG